MAWLLSEAAQKKVFVLPAFETAPNANMTAAHAIAAQAAGGDKVQLASMERKGLVHQFALYIFKTVRYWYQTVGLSVGPASLINHVNQFKIQLQCAL